LQRRILDDLKHCFRHRFAVPGREETDHVVVEIELVNLRPATRNRSRRSRPLLPGRLASPEIPHSTTLSHQIRLEAALGERTDLLA
jgi:hypothetical protein